MQAQSRRRARFRGRAASPEPVDSQFDKLPSRLHHPRRSGFCFFPPTPHDRFCSGSQKSTHDHTCYSCRHGSVRQWQDHGRARVGSARTTPGPMPLLRRHAPRAFNGGNATGFRQPRTVPGIQDSAMPRSTRHCCGRHRSLRSGLPNSPFIRPRRGQASAHCHRASCASGCSSGRASRKIGRISWTASAL